MAQAVPQSPLMLRGILNRIPAGVFRTIVAAVAVVAAVVVTGTVQALRQV